MKAFRQLGDPQCELILQRSCIGISKLYFALRKCPGFAFVEAQEIFHAALWKSLDATVLDRASCG